MRIISYLTSCSRFCHHNFVVPFERIAILSQILFNAWSWTNKTICNWRLFSFTHLFSVVHSFSSYFVHIVPIRTLFCGSMTNVLSTATHPNTWHDFFFLHSSLHVEGLENASLLNECIFSNSKLCAVLTVQSLLSLFLASKFSSQFMDCFVVYSRQKILCFRNFI